MSNSLRCVLFGAALMTSGVSIPATEHYVSPLGGSIAPFTDWAGAATNIQDAIDASVAGDVVWVTNGVYAGGGRFWNNDQTNRVVVDKAMVVRSVNGPGVTTIQGAWDPATTNGPMAVRCAWVADGATLAGFTLCGGASPSSGGGVAGGPRTNAVISNCVIATNMTAGDGGGAFRVSLANCTLVGNRAFTPAAFGGGGGAAFCGLTNCVVIANSAGYGGGGVFGSMLRNCAIVQNSATYWGGGATAARLFSCTVMRNQTVGNSGTGGGVANATLNNSIVYGNRTYYSSPTSNYTSCMMTYCCAAPLSTGEGNIEVDPQVIGDSPHLMVGSPCIGAGTNSLVSGVDIDGQPWLNPPSIGCDEWAPAPVIASQPTPRMVGFPLGLSLRGLVVAGQEPFGLWWSKDGTVLDDSDHYPSTRGTNLVVNNFGPADAGLYQVIASNSFGISTGAVIRISVSCVDIGGKSPQVPYLDWATAATNIQDAIEVANQGDFILVTNGIYASGGRAMAGDLTNRVALTKAVTVAAVNGPPATVIQGAWDPVSTNGPLAARCAWLTNGAILFGFTLTGGATRTNGDVLLLQSGGGAYGTSTDARILNCVLVNNAANYGGGGCCYGQFEQCILSNNSCSRFGGGAGGSTLWNCLVRGNSAVQEGGGIDGGIAVNCTFVENYAYNGGGVAGAAYVYNSIVYSNSGRVFTDAVHSSLYNSCSPFYSTGVNISGPPELLDGIHLSSTSPCRGAGSAMYAIGTDLDGKPWGNPPSIGCYEFYASDFKGPLLVQASSYWRTIVAGSNLRLYGQVTGQASRVGWFFGDGSYLTNSSILTLLHVWTNPGDYPVTFTAYNTDNPNGVSTNILVQVLALTAPMLTAGALIGSNFDLSFAGQPGGYYVVEQTSDVTPPSVWQTVGSVYSTGAVEHVIDSQATNAERFYRVRIP